MMSKAQWLMTVAGLALISGQTAVAQNSDLGFLVGVAQSRVQVSPGGVNRSETKASVQINYAWQFHEGPQGRFYIELPFATVGSASASVGGRQVVARSGGAFFVVPGVRYQHNLTPRVALYVAAGVGAAISHEDRAVVSGGVVTTRGTLGSLAADLGGGVDFRLTRLWSLRGEVRDYISSSDAGLARRNNVMGQFGFALHF